MRCSQRLGVFVALVVCAWSSRALAGMSPTTINAGSAQIGGTTPGGSGTLTGTGHVDLRVGSCSGGGGTFTISPDTNLNLNGAGTMVSVTVTYVPSAAGTRTCTVHIYDTGTTNSIDTDFTVTGTGLTPATLSISPSSGSFTAVRWNDAAPVHTSTVTFTVTNPGDVALSISSVSLGGTNPGDFAITSGGTSATINPGFQRQWVITFDPTTSGSRSATLTFTSNDPASPKVVNLGGSGTNATISVTASIDFLTVLVGSSTPANAVITNNGNAPRGNLYVSNSTITGSSWFTFSACGSQSCNLNTTVLASPNTANVGIVCSVPPGTPDLTTATATVTFGSDSDTGGGNTTTLMCKAGQSNVAAAPSTVQFNGVLVNTTSPPISVTVSNTGSLGYGPFYFDVGGNPAFAVTCSSGCSPAGCGGAGNQCSLSAATSMTLDITFHPTLEIPYSSGLALRLSSGPSASLTLAGRGIDKHIQTADAVLAPDTYRNACPGLGLVPVTVQDTGEYPLHITGLDVSGDPVWSLAEPTTDLLVDGVGSRDLMIRFSPQVAGKAPTGQLTVMSDDTGVPVKIIRLDGNGKDRNVAMTPGIIQIPDTGAGVTVKLSTITDVDHPMLTMTNMDAEDFTIRAVMVDNGGSVFSVRNLDGSVIKDVPIKVGETKQFDVIFAPDKVGVYEGSIKLFLDCDPEPQQSIPVTGQALFVSAHGSSLFGCSAGGGSGSGMLIVIGALLVRRRRRR